MAGLSSTGFTLKTLEELISEIETELKAEISPTLDTSENVEFGRMLRIYASKLAEVWELAQAVYFSQYPDSASGYSLAQVASITGTQKEAETFSRVTATVDLDAGTYAVGTLIAHTDGDPTARFSNEFEIVLGAPAVGDTIFKAEDPGPVRADAGTLTVIAETVSGWNSVTNAADATLGALEESDTSLRTRRVDELAQRGSTTAAAIRAALLLVDGVISCTVIENDTDATVDGVPPHAIEAVVFGGADADIAVTLLEEKAAGIQAFGAEGPFNVADEQGIVHVIDFTRPTEKRVLVEIDITAIQGQYVGDTAIKDAIVDYGDALGVGVDVKHSRLIKEVFVTAGAGAIEVVVKLSFHPAAVAVQNLTVASREKATFDTADVAINLTLVSGAP